MEVDGLREIREASHLDGLEVSVGLQGPETLL